MAALLAESLAAAGFEVQTARDAAEARTVADEFDPDLAVIDIVLGDGPSGLHLAHAFQNTHPGMALLILSEHPDPARASGGMELPPGVGFVRKSAVDDIGVLRATIEAAITGQTQQAAVEAEVSELPLDARQARVLELVAKGYDNLAIAERLQMSIKSAERVVGQIYDQLGIATRSDLNPRVEAARRFIAWQGLPERRP